MSIYLSTPVYIMTIHACRPSLVQLHPRLPTPKPRRKIRPRSWSSSGVSSSKKRRLAGPRREASMETKVGLYKGAADVAFRLLWATKRHHVCAVCRQELKEPRKFTKTCNELGTQLHSLRANQKAARAACVDQRGPPKATGVKQGCMLYLKKLKKICLTKRSCSACDRQLSSATSLGPMLSNIDRLSIRLASKY